VRKACSFYFGSARGFEKVPAELAGSRCYLVVGSLELELDLFMYTCRGLNKSDVKNKLEMMSGQLQVSFNKLRLPSKPTCSGQDRSLDRPCFNCENIYSIVLQQNVTSASLDITDYCGDNGLQHLISASLFNCSIFW